MWWLELGVLVSACDYTLTAQSEETEIWSFLAFLAPTQSPYRLCLTGSDSSHRFTLNNPSSSCASGISDLTIQYTSHRTKCSGSDCAREVLWLHSSQPCVITGNLTFEAVVITGKHHFQQDCEEDWCTQCLSPEFLVSENSNFYTVIDRYQVIMDDSYVKRQELCENYAEIDVFWLERGADLQFKSCLIADIRHRMRSFVAVRDAKVSFLSTKIERTDNVMAFIYLYKGTNCVVSLEDCHVSGLNRDHAYNTYKDTGLIDGLCTTDLTILRSTFLDNLVLNSKATLLRVPWFHLILADSRFERNTGELLLHGVMPIHTALVANVTWKGNFSRSSLLRIMSGYADMRNCTFVDNHVIKELVYCGFTVLDSVLFLNNRKLGLPEQHIINNDLYLPQVTISNCVFHNNKVLDSAFTAYWSDYFLSAGLLNDAELSAEKATFLATSVCSSVLFVAAGNLAMRNTSFSASQGFACSSDFGFEGEIAVLHSLFMSTFSLHSIAVQSNTVELQLTDSVLETAAVFLLLTKVSQFQAENVTFQQATGLLMQSASVLLVSVSATFRNCTWRHNYGSQAGALVGLKSAVTMIYCQFLNNTSETGPGDLLFKADDADSQVIYISHSSFHSSKSSIGAASMLFASPSLSSELVNCVVKAAFSQSGAVITAAHSSGTLLLRNVTFEDINMPSGTLMWVNTTSLSNDSPALIVLESSQVLNCRFSRGIVTLAVGQWPLIVSRFNRFQRNSGALIWLEAGFLQDQGSVFEGNSEGLYFQSTSTVTEFQNTMFKHNRPSALLAMLYIEGPNASASFDNCTFLENQSQYFTEMMQFDDNVRITLLHCVFQGNQASSAFISAKLSAISLRNCSFTHTSDIFQLDLSQISIRECQFQYINSTLGMITLIESSVYIINSTLNHLSGNTGCLCSGLQSNVSLNEVQMYMIDCEQEVVTLSLGSYLSVLQTEMEQIATRGAAFVLSGSSLDIANLRIAKVKQAQVLFSLTEATAYMRNMSVTGSEAMVVQGVELSIRLDRGDFADIHTEMNVGVLECSNCLDINITGSKFINISATSVGGISANSAYFSINNSEFQSLEGQNSGAIITSAHTILLSNTTFLSNIATGPDSSGGGLRLRAPESHIKNCAFQENSATRGGAIHWTEAAPSLLNVKFANNSALYGPDLASLSDYLESDQDGYSLVSGQLFIGEIRVFLKDEIGQTVVTDSETSATLAGPVIKGLAKTMADRGVLVFRGFTAVAKPGVYFVTVTAGAFSLNLKFTFRPCVRGEVLVDLACIPCSIQEYSLSSQETKCEVCPRGGQCPGDGNLYPSPGYWRPNDEYRGVFSCPRQESCLGHANHTTATGMCAEMFTGNLCQSCADEAYRSGQNQCRKCPGETGLQVKASLLGVALPLIWLAVGLIGAKTQGKTRVLFRILLDYLQLTVLVADFDLNWPSVLEYFFIFHHYLGNLSQLFLPIDCIISQPFFPSIIAATLAPIAVVVGFAVLWIILWVILKVFRLHPKSMISGLIVGLVYLHPFVFRILLSVFVCRSLKSGEMWVLAEMNVRCWDKQHMVYALGAALPGLLLWSFGLPVITLLLMIKQRSRLHERHLQMWTGFLCAGFKGHTYYWTLVLLLYKASLVVLYVSIADMTAFTQALLLVFFLSVAGLLQYKCDPYSDSKLGQVDLVGMRVVLCTAYAGLYYSSTGQNTVITALLLALHLWFFAKLIHVLGLLRLRLPWSTEAKQVTGQEPA